MKVDGLDLFIVMMAAGLFGLGSLVGAWWVGRQPRELAVVAYCPEEPAVEMPPRSPIRAREARIRVRQGQGQGVVLIGP